MQKGRFIICISVLDSKYADLLCDFSEVMCWLSVRKVVTAMEFPTNQYETEAFSFFFLTYGSSFPFQMSLSEWDTLLANTLPYNSQSGSTFWRRQLF